MTKKKKYKLDKKADAASRKVVLEAVVQYDIEADEFKTLLALRRDVEHDELVLRIGRQLEGAMRTVMPPYKEEMELLEELAKVGDNCEC
jgi:hypothetical protein